MPDLFHNRPLSSTQQITIDGYVVEITTSSHQSNTTKTNKTFRYTDSNPLIARKKAFRRHVKEEKRMTEQCDVLGKKKPNTGLKLYLEYHEIGDKDEAKPPTKHRLYLWDDEPFSRIRFYERLEEEVCILMLAGASFDTVSFEGGDGGREYKVVAW